MSTDVEQLIRVYFEKIVEQVEIKEVDQIIHPDYQMDPENSLDILGGDSNSGINTFKDSAKRWYEAFETKLLDLEIMTRDNISQTLALYKIKQIGPWLDFEPKSKEIQLWIFYRFTIKDGKIHSIRTIVDYYKFWTELGHETIFQYDDGTDYLSRVQKLKFNW